LEVSPAGAKRGFLKYRKEGKGDKAGRLVQSRMALGSYLAVSWVAARKARDAAKAVKTQEFDPVQARKVDKLKAKALEVTTCLTTGALLNGISAQREQPAKPIHQYR
jgi:hypothetical protein